MGCGSAMQKNQRAIFLLLRSPCTIFVDDFCMTFTWLVWDSQVNDVLQ